MAADNIAKISDATPYFCVVEALSPIENPADSIVVKYGVRPDLIQGLRDQRQYSRLAQFFGLVRKGVILADHLFIGLQRGLYYKGDMDSDGKCLIYVRKPSCDYEWAIDGRGTNGRLIKLPAPDDYVFAVLVRHFDSSRAGGVIGTIERWSWVKEDPGSDGKPIDHQNRYKDRKWSRRQ